MSEPAETLRDVANIRHVRHHQTRDARTAVGMTTELDRITRRAKLVPVDTLEPHPDNPRTITPARLEQLKAALVADPGMLEARPLIALADGRVIGGNQRLLAARELGWKKIPTVVVDLDADTAKLWMLRDNNGYGEWDDGALTAMLGGLGEGGLDLALSGFDEAELERLLAPAPKERGEPPEPGPVPATPRSVRGEVYELGAHRLMCGDATGQGDVAALVGTQALQALWTDPPYGVDYVGKTTKALTIANDGAAGLPALLRAAFAAADAVLELGAPCYVASPAGPRHSDFLAAYADAGWTLHETLVWVKDVMVLGHADYHYRHEPILYGWKPGPGRSGRGNHAGSRWYGDHAQTTVFEVPRPKRSEEHPTMKPVALVEAMLANSTQPGEAVFDPFAGSGTTLIAAEQLGRRCFAMEIDPGYCDVIRDRWAAWNA